MGQVKVSCGFGVGISGLGLSRDVIRLWLGLG